MGYTITFLDGKPLNVDEDALDKITKATTPFVELNVSGSSEPEPVWVAVAAVAYVERTQQPYAFAAHV